MLFPRPNSEISHHVVVVFSEVQQSKKNSIYEKWMKTWGVKPPVLPGPAEGWTSSCSNELGSLRLLLSAGDAGDPGLFTIPGFWEDPSIHTASSTCKGKNVDSASYCSLPAPVGSQERYLHYPALSCWHTGRLTIPSANSASGRYRTQSLKCPSGFRITCLQLRAWLVGREQNEASALDHMGNLFLQANPWKPSECCWGLMGR